MGKVGDFVNEQAKLLRARKIGLEDIRKNKSEYLQFNSKELILAILNSEKMKNERAEGLFRTLPELWKDFNLSDWQYVIQNVNRRKGYRELFDEWACFEDIKFLYKYLEIDSVKLFKEDTTLNDEVKMIIQNACVSKCNRFIKDEMDYENFEDGTWPSIKIFKTAKENLISQGASEAPFISNQIEEFDSLVAYIKRGGDVS